MSTTVIIALYQFTKLPDYCELREPLLAFCKKLGIKGTLLLAEEGINGTIAGPRQAIDQVIAYLKADARLAALTYKESYDDNNPFYRMKVKLKKEIVTLGVDGIDPTDTVGTYVPPSEWNALIEDPEVLLIDTRNEYEVSIGSFKDAVNPHTKSFREFPDYVKQQCDPKQHKKVAMFCTGGIRCEKASAFMLEHGFAEVYHLEGGILNYLKQVPEKNSLWWGECFVFDNRVTVDHDLNKGGYDMCHACRQPIDDQDQQSRYFELGVACPYCYDTLTDQQRTRFTERQKQMALAKQRGEKHIGAPPPQRQGACTK